MFLLFLPLQAFGALSDGTNCGFVTVAPTTDPGGSSGGIDTYARASKFTSPVGATKITELGWYCDNATEVANFQIGLYNYDAANNRPSTQIYSSGDVAKGTGAGWKVVTGLNISISPSTVYEIAVQLDDTATLTNYNNGSSTSAYSIATKNAQTSLPSPWGTNDATNNTLLAAFYAVYTSTSYTGSVIMITEN